MAENLMSYLTTNIHTDVKYLHKLDELGKGNFFSLMSMNNLEYDKKTIVKNLENRESSYYAAVGASTYDQFQNKIKQIINDDVARTLAKFSGSYLRTGLQQLKRQYASQVTEVEDIQNIVIDIKGLKESNIKVQGVIGELRKLSQKAERSSDNSKIKLGIAINTQELKKIINLIEQNSGKSSKAQLREDTDSTAILFDRLTEYSSFIYLSDEHWQAKNTSIKDRLKTNQKFLGYPWNFDIKDVRRAIELGPNSDLQIRLKQALDIIKKWLMEQIQGPDPQNILHDAIEEEWNKIVSINYEDLTNTSFFLKGGYIELVVGALGEFQAAVLNNIIMRATGNRSFASRIQGNEFKEGTSEQAKADVLFGELGIQVKNYASTDFIISGNIHPYDLTKYYSEQDLINSGVFSVLANKFASGSDIIDLNAITADLENAIAAILSLDSMEEHKQDSISFYMIAGRYLVPASVIISDFSGIGGGKSRMGEMLGPVTITGPSPAFMLDEKTNQVSDEVRRKYWKEEDDFQTPTDENTNLFNQLLKRNISLRANFVPSKIRDLNKYALW